ncbi:low affinity iron permease family protein [Chryseobacterium sp. 2R14A]|uniref:low affinity iron permease family protein n=1 Tax=Chryseobacterium sp. 2R14A TaxID=3380353 RepID=UPI003CE940E8
MKKNSKRLTDLTTCFVKYYTAFIETSFLVNFMALVFYGSETLQILINTCTTIVTFFMIFRVPKVRNRILMNTYSWMTSSLQMRKQAIS